MTRFTTLTSMKQSHTQPADARGHFGPRRVGIGRWEEVHCPVPVQPGHSRVVVWLSLAIHVGPGPRLRRGRTSHPRRFKANGNEGFRGTTESPFRFSAAGVYAASLAGPSGSASRFPAPGTSSAGAASTPAARLRKLDRQGRKDRIAGEVVRPATARLAVMVETGLDAKRRAFANPAPDAYL